MRRFKQGDYNMKTLFFILITSLLFLGCYEDTKSFHKDGVGGYIMIIGDSRANYGYQWDFITYEVDNLGRGGEPMEYVITDELIVFSANVRKPDMVIIFTGINDRAKSTPEKFKENLDYTIAVIEAEGVKCVLWDVSVMPGLEVENDEYTEIMKSYPEYYKVDYSIEHFSDGCHFSAFGYLYVSGLINNLMSEHMSSRIQE
jgi:hypothetical protein